MKKTSQKYRVNVEKPRWKKPRHHFWNSKSFIFQPHFFQTRNFPWRKFLPLYEKLRKASWKKGVKVEKTKPKLVKSTGLMWKKRGSVAYIHIGAKYKSRLSYYHLVFLFQKFFIFISFHFFTPPSLKFNSKIQKVSFSNLIFFKCCFLLKRSFLFIIMH